MNELENGLPILNETSQKALIFKLDFSKMMCRQISQNFPSEGSEPAKSHRNIQPEFHKKRPPKDFIIKTLGLPPKKEKKVKQALISLNVHRGE